LTGHGYLFDFVQILQRAQDQHRPEGHHHTQGNPTGFLTKI